MDAAAEPSSRGKADEADKSRTSEVSESSAKTNALADVKPDSKDDSAARPRQKHRWLRRIGYVLLFLIVLLVIARLSAPPFVRWYVNRTLDQNPMYDGSIGGVSIHLYRGAYSIEDVKISKTTGNVPVPLFAAKRVNIQLQWDALMNRKLVGRVVMEQPELNFVDDEEKSGSQTGAGGPWMEMLNDLSPFKINSTTIRDGAIHFRAFHTEPPVDVYLSHLDASIENLTNIRDEINPLNATVKATATAMDQARFEFEMKMNPFSYRPTFELAVRLLGLDVTKTNALARAYGSFDFERGWFDLVVEMDAKEGSLQGYVKPLFRDLQVLSLKRDAQEDNPLQFFWEAVVGITTDLFKNQQRDQLATVIPFTGDLNKPNTDTLATIGNVLRNAFVRAYLPKLEGVAQDIDGGLEFGKGSITEPTAVGP